METMPQTGDKRSNRNLPTPSAIHQVSFAIKWNEAKWLLPFASAECLQLFREKREAPARRIQGKYGLFHPVSQLRRNLSLHERQRQAFLILILPLLVGVADVAYRVGAEEDDLGNAFARIDLRRQR